MKKTIVLPIICLFIVHIAYANISYSGTIYYSELNGLGRTTIDHIYFTVNSPGYVVFDALSIETTWWEDFDVNGDGEIAYIYPHLYLFKKVTDSHVPIYLHDCNSGSLSFDTNGSINYRDPFFKMALTQGEYILTVGCYKIDRFESLNFVNTNRLATPYTDDEQINDHGDYLIDIMGDVTLRGVAVVPSPGSISLALIGIGTMLAKRRGLKK